MWARKTMHVRVWTCVPLGASCNQTACYPGTHAHLSGIVWVFKQELVPVSQVLDQDSNINNSIKHENYWGITVMSRVFSQSYTWNIIPGVGLFTRIEKLKNSKRRKQSTSGLNLSRIPAHAVGNRLFKRKKESVLPWWRVHVNHTQNSQKYTEHLATWSEECK